MRKSLVQYLRFVVPVTGVLLAAGCATTPGTSPGVPPGAPVAAAPGAPGAAGAAPAARPASAAGATPPVLPGQPQPCAPVMTEAKKIDGALTLWQKDDKVWIELMPEDFGKPLLFAPKIARGIGEAGLFGGSMIGPYGRYGRQQLVEFNRVHNLVQLLARNTEFTARDKSPEARAVEAGFSPSLLGSTPVASQPHPERKSILIEANNLFISDMLGVGIALQRQYRQGYAFDGRNSYFTSVRGKPDQVVFDVNAHYATLSIAMPQPGMPPGPAPS